MSCFVDFKKAFDRIPRNKLFEKLRLAGVSGKFLSILSSMYSSDKSAVKLEQMTTPMFTCHTGVKQGCMMSPTLFNFYINDLPEKLNSANTNDIHLNNNLLSCLIYADDLVIFSESAKGLQSYLKTIGGFQRNLRFTCQS